MSWKWEYEKGDSPLERFNASVNSNRSITDPWEVSQDVHPLEDWFDATIKPPNEIWVEVNSNGTILEAMAFHGRDGYKPHWRLRDGTCCHPSRFNSWRYSPMPFQEIAIDEI